MPRRYVPDYSHHVREEYRSAPVDVLTPDHMLDRVHALLDAHINFRRIQAEAEEAALLATHLGRRAERRARSLFWRWLPSRIEQAEHEAMQASLRAATAAESAERAAKEASLEPDGDPPGFHRVRAAFDRLSRCAAIWDITEAHHGEHYRSSVTTSVERKRITLAQAPCPRIGGRFKALRFGNANGAALHLFPDFLVMDGGRSFAVLPADECSLAVSTTRFHETDPVPHDAKQVGTTWQYTNQNGQPDRRFAHNPQVPIMLYGELRITSETGLNELLQFSDPAPLIDFVQAVRDYRKDGLLTSHSV